MPDEMIAVPHSAGTRKPAIAAPEGACDAHIHVYDRRFPMYGSPDAMLDNATADDYRLLQQRTGTQRTVIVQPRAHGTDNSVTLAAIRALGAHRTRGVAVVRPEVSDAELKQLHEGGIRGIRFTLYTSTNAATDFSMVEPLAHRVHALGWHVQLHWSADQIAAHAALLDRLPCTVVFDHLARLPQPDRLSHPACRVVSRLLDNGRTWIKLSGAYLDSAAGAEGGYADTIDVARAWATQAPERVVWGSDWPHPTERTAKPDDAQLFDLLGRWVPDEAARHRVLVDNPARLYDFS
ncbi:amidohydrolase family protein [Variovorax guangxiensis]|uniref:Putative TIM-barrel fold metal-dependent hydrolase n=1 Tax=Variovorax guangxiensis TaxID=1775474 RepID=A0A840FXQ9_9BURK|nr:amidohydrolase family protein [Variovorax guangxiensis]MBB4225054.1 putative TIM-barrel fold metal-dependent hydrolase [Variovorax guangxiensis]